MHLKTRNSIENYNNDENIFDLVSNNCYKCNICGKKIKYIPKQGVKIFKRHTESKYHQKSVSARELQKEFSMDEFNKKLILWMIRCNIPFTLLDKDVFTDFISSISGMKTCGRINGSGQILQDMYELEKSKILIKLKGKKFYIMVDESPDAKGRKIVNVLVGLLDQRTYVRPFLLETVELIDVNHHSLSNLIVMVASRIVSSVEDYDNFVLLLTDGAAYCRKTGTVLKLLYPELKHVICVVHNIHNLSETIRSFCPFINLIASKLKKYFKYNSKNKRNFTAITGLKTPNFPILTRWGTFIDFAEYLYYNFQVIENFFKNQKANKKVRKIISLLEMNDILKELRYISDYFYIPKIIKKLEARNLKCIEVAELIMELRSNLKDERLTARYDDILAKNPDLAFFMEFNLFKCALNDRDFLYASLTTVEVERSFSMLNHVLTKKRSNMSINTLAACLFYYFNNEYEYCEDE